MKSHHINTEHALYLFADHLNEEAKITCSQDLTLVTLTLLYLLDLIKTLQHKQNMYH